MSNFFVSNKGFLSITVGATVAVIEFTLLEFCVSSMRRGHDNLLCIVPILTDDPHTLDGAYPKLESS